MSDLSELTSEFLKDPEFRKEYEALQFERDAAMAQVKVRQEADQTFKSLDKEQKLTK